MKTAKLVVKKDHKTSFATANQKVYELSVPLDGHKFVLVSAAWTMDHGNETYIFGCTKEGQVKEWGELDGSYVGGLDHEKALRNAGYKVIE